jgi:hypothetical protein
MKNEGDHRRAHPVEDRLHHGEAAIVDVERAEHGDDDEVGQDEGPAAGPRSPEAPPNVRDPDTYLNGQRARQRLADRDALSHLFLREPFPFADQFPLHLSDKSDGAAKADQSETEVIANELSDGDAPR